MRLKRILVGVWLWVLGLFRVKGTNKMPKWLSWKLFKQIEAKKIVRLTAIGVILGSFLIVSPALAQNETSSVNWTALGDVIRGFVDLMPDIVDLVIALVPLIIVLVFVAFFRGLLEKIVGMIKGGMNF